MTRGVRRQLQPPPDDDASKRPLREVVQELSQLTQTLNRYDDEISQLLRDFEEIARQRRPTGRPVDVVFPPWGKLGWTGRRGRWRLVVVDDEECEDLLSMPRDCRHEACHVLWRLAERMGLLDDQLRRT